MKKTILSFFALSIFSLSLHAQVNYTIHESTYQKITISFTFGELKSEKVITEEGSFSRIFIEGCANSSNTGNPELPISVSLLEIPFFEDYVLNVYGNDFVIYDAKALGIHNSVFPAQPPLSKSSKGRVEFILNKNTYQTDAFYALPLAQFDKIGFMRNVNLGQLYVNPVQYNPVTHEIKIYHSIDVEILFKQTDIVKTQTLKELHKNPLLSPSHLINSENVNHFSRNGKAGFLNTPIKYLIVAHSMFSGALDEFIAWKKRKGFIVEIGYTDEENVGNSTTSIAAFIKSHYSNATIENPAPTYVLLVGDVQQIPAFLGITEPHPTDLYYFTWEGGNIPCCYYGRFSAQNLIQLTPQIEKTLEYEQYTMPDPHYLDKVSLVAGFDKEAAPIYGNGLLNYVTQYYANVEYGYATVYEHYHPCNLDAGQIRAEIGAGVGLANFTAHCNELGWSSPDFTTNHIPAMNNMNKYGLMIGSCCLSNKFDYNECFGEALLRTPGKGAVGYIGGSNNTYWNEDYYWGIGFRNRITEYPAYTPYHLGVYDRLFHTHEEENAKWMVTFGSMNFAGNEAVQASTSTLKQYYWEIYHLMGDPSVMAYLTKPSPMKVEMPNEILAGETSLNAKVAPYSYCALTDDNGELLSTGFADATGNVILHFAPVGASTEYEFAAWAQSYIQFFQTISIASEDSFVVGSVVLAKGNTLHNDATIYFDVTIQNKGKKAVSNIKLTLSTESNDAKIVNNTATAQKLAAGEEKTVAKLFKTKIKNFVQDGTPITFFLNIVTDKNSFQKSIKFEIQAPKLEVSNIQVSKISGTGDIEPGDEINIEFELTNIGKHDISDVFSSASCYFSGFKLFNNTKKIALLETGASEKIVFQGKIETSVNKGAIPIYFYAFKGGYSVESTAVIVVGTFMEDFETGDFSKYDWKQGINPWEITTSNLFQGNYCARSKTGLVNSSASQLKITAYIADTSYISYVRKVSSRAEYDFFRFYIDDIKKEQKSGTINNWGYGSFEVEPGIHTFMFEYSKDVKPAAGEDCAWIDNIMIPGMTVVCEDLSKLKVLSHTLNVPHIENKINADSALVNFNLKNIGTINAYQITCELLCKNPDIKIIAENTTHNQSLPFEMEINQEKSIEFKIIPNSVRYLNSERNEFVLKVSYGNDIIYYPLILEFAKPDFPNKTKCLIYPNPACATMIIETKNQMIAFEIIDLNGKVITSQKNVNDIRAQINVSSLSKGIYFVRVIDYEQKIAVQKFVKQ
jgi:hypothetical protein